MKNIYIILQRDPYSPAGAIPVFASENIEVVEDYYKTIVHTMNDVYIDEVELS